MTGYKKSLFDRIIGVDTFIESAYIYLVNNTLYNVI